MADLCIVKPTVKGEISKLYEELYEYTGKDRKLTNLLYALSFQDSVKRLFSHSDFNRQGEISSDKFIEKFNVQGMLDSKQQIKVIAKSLGVIDSSEQQVEFDTLDQILDTIIQFNTSQDDFRGFIRLTPEGKFVVDIDIVNAENVNSGYVLQKRKNQFGAMLSYLGDNGFNTDLSTEVKQFFNALNFYSQSDQIKQLTTFDFTSRITVNRANLILQLMKNDANVQRFLAAFKDTAGEVLASITGTNTFNSVEDSMDPAYWRGKGIQILMNAKQKFSSLDTRELDKRVTDAIANLPAYSYKGIDGISLRETLQDLYDKFYLDTEIKQATNQNIKTASDAATELLNLALRNMQIESVKAGGKIKIDKKKLDSIQKQISIGKYYVGIARLLEDVNKLLTSLQEQWNNEAAKAETEGNTITNINILSGILLKQLKEVKAYKDVIRKLKDKSTLENNDEQASPDLIDQITETADGIYQMMDKFEDVSRQKMFDLVYSFLKIYWGEDKQFGGTLYSLRQMMENPANEIGWAERLLFSATESSDPILALVGEVMKTARDTRDERLLDIQKRIREATDALYKAGGNSSFMYKRDAQGIPTGMLISKYDYDKFAEEEAKEIQRVKALKLSKNDEANAIYQWRQAHTQSVKPFDDLDYTIVVPVYEVPNWDANLTRAQRDYYNKMMHLKAEMQMLTAVAYNDLYQAVQISSNLVEASTEKGAIGALESIKQKFSELFSVKEDDDAYGYSALMKSGQLAQTITDLDDTRLLRLPLFFTHKLTDQKRLSTDFSRSLMAFSASTVNYDELSKVESALLLTKEWLLSRNITTTKGGAMLANILGLNDTTLISPVTRKASTTKESRYIEDVYERLLYNQKKKDDTYLFGNKISAAKAADSLVMWTSIKNLSVNLLGAEANLFIGKIQMWIESGLGLGGEFFGVKDYNIAQLKYFRWLPEFLTEITSNTKKSKLGLLMEKFDASQDWYEKLKEDGFFKSNLGKILGNTNLMFLYGMGEHVLRGETMLAVLQHEKVKDSTGNVIPLVNALEVKIEGNNGSIQVVPGCTKLDGTAIDDEYLNKVKKRINYVNKSMHGAFNDMDKGMIHRYALGRLVMNFRQWMPAHYGRRFRGRYYDADLEEFREGYYVTTFNFLKDCVKDLKNRKLDIAARWDDMTDMEKYNLKRTIAEVMILSLISAAIALMADEKDKKGNWAYRNLLYQLKRMQMETMASSPVWVPWSKQSPYSFVENIIKTLNSPMACLNSVEDIFTLVNFTAIFDTIEEGKYKGENRYLHNLEMKAPFYGMIKKTAELGTSDDYFKLFRSW